MMAELAAARTPEEKQAVIQKYNSQQARYGQLRPKFTDLSSVTFNQSVKDYQDLINSDFNFVNSGGINNGVNSGRYLKIGTKNRIGKDLADKWTSDGYWAGQTQDRTTLGYKGDWDEDSDAFKNWQKSLNDIGLETYLDVDNTYKLRLLRDPETPLPPKTHPTEPSIKEPPQEEPGPGPWNPVEYNAQEKPQRKFRIPTFPLYNAALHGIASATNKKVLSTLLKTPTLMLEAPTLYGKVTDAYAERSANEQAMQRYKWGVQQQLDNTNDLGKSQEAYRDILGKELDMQMQNNKAKQDEYNQTSQNLQNISNTNKQNWTNIANQNRQNYVADMRDKLNKIAQYHAQQGQLAQENVMANYTDWKAWNRNNQLQDYADWKANEYAKVQQDLDKAYENWQNSGDISQYQGYKDFWASIVDKEGNIADDKGFGTAYATYLGPNGEDTEETRLKFFKDNYQNEAYKNQLGSFAEGWNKYQTDAMNRYAKDYKTIQTRWGLLDSRGKPINFDGEVSSWLYNRMNPRGSYNSIYSMAKGGRFLEYLRHNRRAEKEIRDTTMKSMQDSRKLLARELDALDRESLLLLRAIFK